MSTYALDAVFRPKSVAVVGASPRERSVGRAVVRNLREAGFAGPVGLVNPKHRQIDGVPAVARLADLPFKPELVVVVESLRSEDDMRALFRDEVKPRLAKYPEIGAYNQEI